MSVFDDLEDAVSDACDDVFSGWHTLRPMTKADVNVRATPDASRQGIRFLGIFDSRHIFHEASSGGLTDYKRISVGRDDMHTIVSVDERRLAPSDVREKDRLLREKTGDVYEIARALPDGLGRTVLVLTHLTRETI